MRVNHFKIAIGQRPKEISRFISSRREDLIWQKQLLQRSCDTSDKQRDPPRLFREIREVRGIRCRQGGHSTLADFQDLIRNGLLKPRTIAAMLKDASLLAQKLKEIENAYGTATAFVLGALVCSGIVDIADLCINAKRVDDLFSLIKSQIHFYDFISKKRLLKRTKEILWEMSPARYSNGADPAEFYLSKALEKYLSREPSAAGHCVALTALDSVILMKFGFNCGFILEPDGHVYSFIEGHNSGALGRFTLENTTKRFEDALLPAEEDENTGRIYNYLGYLGAILTCYGNYLASKGRDIAAEAKFCLAIRLCPNYAVTHNSLGMLDFERKFYPKAEKFFSNAIALEKNVPEFWMHRYLARKMRGRFEEAKADWFRCQELIKRETLK